jgi:hypothetical protein
MQILFISMINHFSVLSIFTLSISVWFRIGRQYSLVCRKKLLIVAVIWMRQENLRSVSQEAYHDKDASLLKGSVRRS